MDGNPEGTPNPLNPMPGTASADNTQPGEEMAAGAGTANRAETVQPASFAQGSEPSTITGLTAEPVAESTPEPVEASAPAEAEPTGLVAEPAAPKTEAPAPESVTTPEPVATSEPIVEPVTPKVAPPKPIRTRGGAVDPMMRKVAKPAAANTATMNVASTTTRSENKFDTLAMDDVAIDELTQTPAGAGPNATPDLVAKDSVVESADGKGGKNGKKKALVICSIVLLMIAVICGAAAIAVALVNNNTGDRVTKAIEKLIDGKAPMIVAAQGRINTSVETIEEAGEVEETAETDVVGSDEAVEEIYGSVSLLPTITNTSIDFDGTFDFNNSTNKVAATVTLTDADENDTEVNINELTAKDGSVFFKLDGLSDIINSNSSNTLMSLYKGLLEAIDDEWILVSSEFGDATSSISVFDNNSTCLVNAFGTLPKYSQDLLSKYKANQFITYSTDNLKISKKKNDLYRLGFDNDKLTAFTNSLGNNGFINELNACAGSTATNSDAAVGIIKAIFGNFPTIYVEVDENYDFTRVYLELKTDDTTASSHTKADINLSYPSELKITEPSDYVEMSTLLSNVMSNLVTTNTAETVEETTDALPDDF